MGSVLVCKQHAKEQWKNSHSKQMRTVHGTKISQGTVTQNNILTLGNIWEPSREQILAKEQKEQSYIG